MKVKDFKNLPEEFDNLDVFMSERTTDFTYGLVNSFKIKEINFSEEPDGEVLAREKVLILDEE